MSLGRKPHIRLSFLTRMVILISYSSGYKMDTEKEFGANGGHLELLTITLDISINEVFKDLI